MNTYPFYKGARRAEDSIRPFFILPRHQIQYHGNETFPNPALEQHLIGTEAVGYATGAWLDIRALRAAVLTFTFIIAVTALTFLLYDIFITFDDEVRRPDCCELDTALILVRSQVRVIWPYVLRLNLCRQPNELTIAMQKPTERHKMPVLLHPLFPRHASNVSHH